MTPEEPEDISGDRCGTILMCVMGFVAASAGCQSRAFTASIVGIPLEFGERG